MIAHADSPATATIAGSGQPAAASVRPGRAGHLGGEAQAVTLPGGGASAGMGKIASAGMGKIEKADLGPQPRQRRKT